MECNLSIKVTCKTNEEIGVFKTLFENMRNGNKSVCREIVENFEAGLSKKYDAMLEAYAVYLECIEEIKETKRTVTAHFVTGSMGFSFMNDMTKMLEQHAKTIKVSGYGDEEGWEY